jgi:hypothetical protein
MSGATAAVSRQGQMDSRRRTERRRVNLDQFDLV